MDIPWIFHGYPWGNSYCNDFQIIFYIFSYIFPFVKGPKGSYRALGHCFFAALHWEIEEYREAHIGGIQQPNVLQYGEELF